MQFEFDVVFPCMASIAGLPGIDAIAAISNGQAECPIEIIEPVTVVVDSPSETEMGKAALASGDYPPQCPLCKRKLDPRFCRRVIYPRPADLNTKV